MGMSGWRRVMMSWNGPALGTRAARFIAERFAADDHWRSVRITQDMFFSFGFWNTTSIGYGRHTSGPELRRISFATLFTGSLQPVYSFSQIVAAVIILNFLIDKLRGGDPQ